MNLNDYVKAMDNIHADQEKLLKKTQKKASSGSAVRQSRFFMQTAAAVLALALLTAALWNAFLSGREQSLTITVHAAGSDNALLPGDAVSVQCTADPLYEAVDTEDQKGIVNYDLWLECTGEDIASVTYRCQDIPVTKENLGTVPCYFVRNMVIPVREREQYDYIRSLQSGTEQEQEICHIVQLVGNEYTVSYEEQEGQSTGIEVRIVKEGDAAKADPFRIDVLVTLTDGSIRNRTLLLTPGNDAFCDLRIELQE